MPKAYNRAMVRLARALGVVLSLMALTACGKVQAKTPAPPPSLVPPPPPSPLIVPVTIEYVEPEPPSPPATTPPANTTKPPTPPKPAGNAGTPPATTTAPPPETPVTAPPVLQTAPNANATEAERGVRDKIETARTDLGKVTYTTLSKDAKTSYDSAKRFIQIAEDNIRTKNFPYAMQMATKAAELAAQLPKSDQ